LNVKEQLYLLSAIEETVRIKTRKNAFVNIQLIKKTEIKTPSAKDTKNNAKNSVLQNK